MDRDYILSLIHSMPSRLKAVIRSHEVILSINNRFVYNSMTAQLLMCVFQKVGVFG